MEMPDILWISLLRLPYTLRETIWQYAFGGSLIHIHYSTEACKFTTFFCQHALETASELQGLVVTSNRAPCIAIHPDVPDPFRTRHHLCQKVLDQRNNCFSQTRVLEWNIGAMFASRQCYEEIYPVLYGTNVLQVESATTFAALMAVLDRQGARTPLHMSPRLPSLHLRLEIVVFNKNAARYWPLVLTPKAGEWVEAHVRRLELTGAFTGRFEACQDVLSSLSRWHSSLDIDSFAEYWVQAFDWQPMSLQCFLRAPSPQRLIEKDLCKEYTRASFRQNADRQHNISPLFHIRRALARLHGLTELQTIEQYKEEQSETRQRKHSA